MDKKACFLAHLSKKCFRWAFVVAHCPSSVRPSILASINNFFKQLLLRHHQLDFDQTSQKWSIIGWSSTKFVQTIPVDCISRSWDQKIGFQNAIIKNILWNNKAQSFYIWYITSSRGPLPKLFKLCPAGQNWTRPGEEGVHNFTLNYIRKTSNDFFSWTANGNMTKLDRNGLWVVLYQNCSNSSDWLH